MTWPLDHIPHVERRAAAASVAISLLLLTIKFLAYFMTGSAAVFSDALESIVNVVASSFAFYSLYWSHMPADRDHPYGHGKVEFVSAGFEGGMILLAAAMSAIKAGENLFRSGQLRIEHLPLGILLLLLALSANTTLGLILRRLGRRNRSAALEADGEHVLSDAVTSATALGALVAVRTTHRAWIDSAAAVVVAGYISWIGIRLIYQSVGGLMDRQDVEDQRLLRAILDAHLGPSGKFPQICSYHKLRHRHSGRYHWVDFHIMVPGDWDIRRGHEVASTIEYEIELALKEGNATAHIEPCPGHEECGHCQQTVANRSSMSSA